MPYGINSVFMAITTAGMIYVFNGFQLCTSFASEIKNPNRNIPLGMILSLIICFIIYILLQFAFMGAIDPSQIAEKGWQSLFFESPFVQLVSMLGMNFMAIIIYVGAVAAPTGTGITFVGSASRILYGMSKERQMPKRFSILDPKLHFSKSAMGFNFLITLIFLVLFHSWSVLILFITALIVLMYMVVPLSLVGLRNGAPDAKRAFKLPLATPICYLLFISQAIIFVFIGSTDMLYMTIALTIFMIVFISINRSNKGHYSLGEVVYVSAPLIVFLWLLTVLIYLGPVEYGGFGFLNIVSMFVIIITLGIIAFYYMTRKFFVAKCRSIREKDNIQFDTSDTE